MIGLLPALGTTLAALEASGQLERCQVEWRVYAGAFGGARWFGYGREGATFAIRVPGKPVEWAVAMGRPWWVPSARSWALLMPLARDFRACSALRVLNLTGVIPALIARDLWGLPYVLQVGYDAPAVARAHGKRVRAWFLRHLQDLAVQRATGVIYASSALLDADGQRGLFASRHRAKDAIRLQGRFTVIPNGVDLEHFRPLWRCPSGKSQRRVVYVGRLSREKNLDLLAAACQRVGATLHLFGAGPLAAELAALPVVTAYGPVPHYSLPAILADMDCFAMVSETEGSSKAVLESMATGLPCILSEGASRGLGPWNPAKPAWIPAVPALEAALDGVLGSAELAQGVGRLGRALVEARHDLKKTLRDEIAFVHNAVEGACAKEARQA